MLIDELVLPKLEIKDYNTKFSGITKDMLDKCTTTFEQIQVLATKLNYSMPVYFTYKWDATNY